MIRYIIPKLILNGPFPKQVTKTRSAKHRIGTKQIAVIIAQLERVI